jgi:dsRNA-specific ribonuclease
VIFECAIIIQDKIYGHGQGKNKKRAQEDAAKSAYHNKNLKEKE